MSNIITAARVIPGTGFGSKDQLHVTINGQEKVLFDFFGDELSFWAEEFVGKTEDEGHALFTKKDVAYLQS